VSTDQTEPAAPPPAEAPTKVVRPTISCPGCGAPIEGDQAWCTECGLAARTRIAPTPNWRLPLVLAGALALGAVVALVVAFVVLTGDNAPLPETTPTAAAPADTVPTTSVPIATTPTTTLPTATTPTVPVTTVPATTTPVTTVPTTPTATTPTITTPSETGGAAPTATATTP
jgi:predicted nucleic acid-binding Zn ribbon protein